MLVTVFICKKNMDKKGLFGFIESPEGILGNHIECGRSCGALSVIVMEGTLDAWPSDLKKTVEAPCIVMLPGNTDLTGYAALPGFKGYLVSFGQGILKSIGKKVVVPESRALGKEEASMIPLYFDIIKDNSSRTSNQYGEYAEFCMEQALALKLFP